MSEKIAKGREVITALTGNTDFAAPKPTQAITTTVTDDLETAQQEQQAAKRTAVVKTLARDKKEDLFDSTLTQLSAHVESAAGDNERLTKNAGMTREIRPCRSHRPTRLSFLNLNSGDADGEIDLNWGTGRLGDGAKGCSRAKGLVMTIKRSCRRSAASWRFKMVFASDGVAGYTIPVNALFYRVTHAYDRAVRGRDAACSSLILRGYLS